MKLTHIFSKSLLLVCGFAVLLLENGCYSHFAMNRSIQDAEGAIQEISKIKLKNGEEINFTSHENVLTSIDADSITYLNNKSQYQRISITYVEQWYSYQFDDGKTFFTALWVGISALLLLYFLHPGFSLGG